MIKTLKTVFTCGVSRIYPVYPRRPQSVNSHEQKGFLIKIFLIFNTVAIRRPQHKRN